MPTEVSLPPPGEGMSLGVAPGEVLPQHALFPGKRPTVTCVADNGLGDRFGALFDAMWLAYVLDANFHILWNMNNECNARFGVLFKFNGTHSTVEDDYNGTAPAGVEAKLKGRTKDFDAILTLKHHRGTSHLLAPEESRLDAPSFDKQWLSHTARPIALGRDSPLVKWADARQRAGMRVHILHHSDRLAPGVTLEGVKAAVAHFGFRLRPELWNRVHQFCQKNDVTPASVLGIHLRGTDARIPLKMDMVISDVRRRFSQSRFYVCSDEKAKEEEFINAFPGRVVRNTFKATYASKKAGSQGWRIAGVSGSSRFNVFRSEASVVDALTDLAILSRTQKPQVKGVLRDSSFGKSSTRLCIVGISCDDSLSKMAVKAAEEMGTVLT